MEGPHAMADFCPSMDRRDSDDGSPSAEDWLERGDALQLRGSTEYLREARDCFRRAAELTPDDVEAWTSLGTAQLELGSAGEAAASFGAALALDPDDADLAIYRRRAEARSIAESIARRRGVAACTDDTVARIDFELDASTAALRDADLWARRGCALWRIAAAAATTPEEAQLRAAASHAMALVVSTEYLNDALALVGDHRGQLAEVWNARGEALMMQLRRFEDALVDFDRALALAPHHREAALNRTCVLRDLFFDDVAAAAAEEEEMPPSHCDVARAAPYRTLTLPLPAKSPFALSTPLHSAHCLRWLDRATCAWIIRTADAHAARAGTGWTLPSRGEGNALSVPEVAVSAVPTLSAWLAPLLHFALRPTLARLFKLPPERLLFREVLVVRYEAAGNAGAAAVRAKIPLHRDGNLLAWNVALNDCAAFTGGGTVLASLKETVLLERAGDLLVHAGSMLHGSGAVTSGTRFILVGFVEAVMELEVECAMRRIVEREEAQGEMGCERDHEHLERYWKAAAEVEKAEAVVV